MENEQNNGRPVEFTDEERLARVVGATGIHDLAEAGFVVMTIKDAEAAEADTALLRQALLEVIRGYGVHGHYHAFDTARTALSSTNAGQSLLDRLKSAEEQVQQLTKERDAAFWKPGRMYRLKPDVTDDQMERDGIFSEGLRSALRETPLLLAGVRYVTVNGPAGLPMVLPANWVEPIPEQLDAADGLKEGK